MEIVLTSWTQSKWLGNPQGCMHYTLKTIVTDGFKLFFNPNTHYYSEGAEFDILWYCVLTSAYLDLMGEGSPIIKLPFWFIEHDPSNISQMSLIHKFCQRNVVIF